MTTVLPFLTPTETMVKTEYPSDIDSRICIFCPSKVLPSINIVKQYRNYAWQQCDYCVSLSNELCTQQHYEQKNEAGYFCSYCITGNLKFDMFCSHLRRHYNKESCVCLVENQDIHNIEVDIKKEAISSIYNVHTNNLKLNLEPFTGEKPLHYEFESTNKKDLKLNSEIHKEERPFHCDLCDFKSCDSSSLKQHIRTHTGERPFHDLCNYRSKSSGDLKLHTRTNTDETPFNCDYCDYMLEIINLPTR